MLGIYQYLISEYYQGVVVSCSGGSKGKGRKATPSSQRSGPQLSPQSGFARTAPGIRTP